jgi:hypothetical protein
MSAVELATHSGDEAQLRAAVATIRTEEDSPTLEDRVRALPGDPVIRLLTEIRDLLKERA